MVMDENDRNGGKWHLAQQLAQRVIIQKPKTTIHITCNHAIMHILFITIISTQMGGFLFLL